MRCRGLLGLEARIPLGVLSCLFVAALLGCSCEETESPKVEVTREQLAKRGDGAPSAPTASASAPADNAPSETTLRAQQALVELGKTQYDRYCRLCHGEGAKGYAADNAPSLVTESFLKSASDEFIAQGIRMGRPNTPMAAYGKARGGPLNERDIDAIVAYLRSLGAKHEPLPAVKVSGNPQRGAEVFSRQCRECHGDETKRGTAPHLHNPEFLAAASPAFIEYAILYGRPPTPMLGFKDKLSKPEVADLVAFLHGMRPTTPTAPVRQSQVPEDLPIVINPKGKAPEFKLRSNRFVSAAQVKQALDEKRRIVLVDARSPSDWIQFHIPGAVPIAYYETDKLAKIPNDGTWVVAYCACPHHASGEVVDALRAKGYPHAAVLDEGILVWRERGYPIAGEAVTPPSK